MVTGGGAYIANGLYNADCITAMRTMPNECVDMVLTDPPYNINFVPQRTAERGAILNDNLSAADFEKLLGDYFAECYRLLKPDTFAISFMSWATIPAFEKAIRAAGFQIKSMPIWVKNNFGIGYYTRPQYEPMYLAIKGTPAPRFADVSLLRAADTPRRQIRRRGSGERSGNTTMRLPTSPRISSGTRTGGKARKEHQKIARSP